MIYLRYFKIYACCYPNQEANNLSIVLYVFLAIELLMSCPKLAVSEPRSVSVAAGAACVAEVVVRLLFKIELFDAEFDCARATLAAFTI